MGPDQGNSKPLTNILFGILGWKLFGFVKVYPHHWPSSRQKFWRIFGLDNIGLENIWFGNSVLNPKEAIIGPLTDNIFGKYLVWNNGLEIYLV